MGKLMAGFFAMQLKQTTVTKYAFGNDYREIYTFFNAAFTVFVK